MTVATAKMLGVDETTIRRDLGTKAPANAELAPEPAAETQGLGAANSANAEPAWFQDDVDPAKLAKTQASRKRKEADLASPDQSP